MLNIGSLELPDVTIMGVLNVTPDSFSDGGRFVSRDSALAQAEKLIADGAAIVDVGGESTRPGSSAVEAFQEIDRVVPVIEALVSELDATVSVDTTKPQVMRAAAAAGAAMINDVRALQDDGALQAASEIGVPVCLMHMQGLPRTMQDDPQYGDVVEDVCTFLARRLDACVEAGIPRDHIVVDPGFGFGKTMAHNLALLKHLNRFTQLGVPVLAGLSRKSSLGQITGRAVDERMPASIVAAAIAVQNGASIIRAHDVAETADAINVVRAVTEAK
jgi:dihydropteroate synthase